MTEYRNIVDMTRDELEAIVRLVVQLDQLPVDAPQEKIEPLAHAVQMLIREEIVVEPKEIQEGDTPEEAEVIEDDTFDEIFNAPHVDEAA